MRKRVFGNILMAGMVLLLFHPVAHAFNLPDTGQTLCYDAGGNVIACNTPGYTGQDGAYDINPMSYTDNGNGTVTDNNTGVMWQRCSVGQDTITCSGTAALNNWYQAVGEVNATYNPSGLNYKNVCGALNTSNFGGHNDWGLPTEQELQTIVDYAIPYPGPTIRTVFFPNTRASGYWSSPKVASFPSYAWYVNFYMGFVNRSGKEGTGYVRCVRGGQFAKGFTNNVNGTVNDNNTGLVWQQDEPGAKTWGDALSYCEGLNLGGHDDWRLPNAKELRSLVDSSRYNPSINTEYFPNAVVDSYWSSTTFVDYAQHALGVFFYDGIVADYTKENSLYVRCVRGGSLGNFIRLMPSGNTYPTFYDAYVAAGNTGDTIQAQAVVSTEELLFASPKAVFLEGGFDSGFTPTADFTTVKSLTIIAGTVTIEKIIIE